MSLLWPSAEARKKAGELARTPRLLLALDFDGTVAPLVDDPMMSRATPAARAVVDRLASLPETWVAFVSGRSMDVLRQLISHDERSPLLLAGSHGVELWVPGAGPHPIEDAASTLALQEELAAAAEAAVSHLPGVWIERKTFGFGVPTRLATADDERRAFEIVDDLVSDRAPQWRRRAGHNIVEYSSRHDGKDAALERLRAETGASAVFFAGDDVTDEDALAALRGADLGVRVGEGETSAAVRVDDIDGIVALLEEIARVREDR